MIYLRDIQRGITDHFPLRVSEWVMVYPTLGMWIAFQLQPNMFDAGKSFTTVAGWAEEQTWAYICLFVALTRLTALSVNGTFKGFPFSPHMRAAASLAGVVFWSQFSLGFLVEFLFGAGIVTAFVAYSSFCLLELVNVYRSWSDIASVHKGARDGLGDG
ncbi:MAG: hypothetical protein AB7O39_03085 [Flavobacteriaceae bacterium]